MAIAGIDIGTTGCKCTVYSKEGAFLNEAYKEYKSNSAEKINVLDPLIV